MKIFRNTDDYNTYNKMRVLSLIPKPCKTFYMVAVFDYIKWFDLIWLY